MSRRTVSATPNKSVCATPAITCRGAAVAQRTALCAGLNTRSHHLTKQWGREQPPDFTGCPVPRTTRVVAHASVSMSRSHGNAQAICAPIARVLSRAYTPQIVREVRGTFNDGFSYLRPIEGGNEGLVDQNIVSWNHIVLWVRQLETLSQGLGAGEPVQWPAFGVSEGQHEQVSLVLFERDPVGEPDRRHERGQRESGAWSWCRCSDTDRGHA